MEPKEKEFKELTKREQKLEQEEFRQTRLNHNSYYKQCEINRKRKQKAKNRKQRSRNNGR